MFQAINLAFKRLIQLRAAVAMNICPHGGDSVEVTVAVRVDQPAPLPFLDDNLIVTLPILHLGKGVPDMPLVQGSQLLCGYRDFVVHELYLAY
jgi:hypothetical protein